MIRLTADLPTLDFAKSDEEETYASISGIAVPWAPVTATVLGGQRVAFSRGAFDVNQKAAKLIEGHDLTQLRGTVNSLADFEEGLGFTATFARTRASADAIELVKAGAYDAVSVGADVIESYYDKELKATVVTKANLIELSLVAVPAFSGAEIRDIAAQADDENEPDETEESPTETNPPTPSEEDEMSEPTSVEAAVATQPIYATAKREFKMPTAAEYISKFVQGGAEFAEFSARIQAAAPDVTADPSLLGVLPTPIIQPLYDSLDPIRPVVSAIGARSMPSTGATFRRPILTVRPTATVQGAELDTLDPSTVTVTNNNVNKQTVGTYVLLSEQSIDWADPSSVDIVLRQLAIAYGQATDLLACTAITTGTAQTEAWDSTDSQATITGIYNAAATISAAGNYLPTHAFVSPDVWAKLGSLCDLQGRPLFPTLAPMNAAGVSNATTWNGNPLGLSLVVDKNFTTAGTFIIGHAAGAAAGFEFYEQNKGAVSVEVPSQLGRTVAYRGYAATFMANPDMFVQMVDAA
jgi:HK97 family phage prohead protease